MPDGNNSPDNRISRRDFLKKSVKTTAKVAGTIGVIGGGAKLIESLISPDDSTSSELTFGDQKIHAEIGNSESLNLTGLQWFPDGHSPFIKNEDGVKVWLAGGPQGYMFTGRDLNHLDEKATEVIGPSGEGFDRDYAAPGSVLPGKNDGELLMFYHGENHPYAPNFFPFGAGIGLAVSTDGGFTWERKGQIIQGKNDKQMETRPYGAGQPSVLVKDGHLHIYYIDWNGQDPDSIHLARAPIDSDGMPGAWKKYNNGDFSEDGLGGQSSPVILPSEGGDYSALPGVSFNSFLNKYMSVFESKDGFYMTTSVDGIEWLPSQKLLGVQTANTGPEIGDTWNSNPTLWSPNKSNDRETDANMLLVYSQGKWQQKPHSMKTRTIQLSKAQQT